MKINYLHEPGNSSCVVITGAQEVCSGGIRLSAMKKWGTFYPWLQCCLTITSDHTWPSHIIMFYIL